MIRWRGASKKPETMSADDWTKKNRQAVAFIRQWVDDSVYHLVSKEKDASILWKKLADLYERKNGCCLFCTNKKHASQSLRTAFVLREGVEFVACPFSTLFFDIIFVLLVHWKVTSPQLMHRFRPTLDRTRTLVQINTTIVELVRSGQNSAALQLFSDLHSSDHVTPDQYSLSSAITASSITSSSSNGLQLHSYAVRSGLNSFPHVANSLLSFYAKSKITKFSQRLFDEIPSPDSYSWTSLISAYMKVGCIEYALRVFYEMPNRDVAHWNAVITGLAENDFGDLAVEMFVTMHRAGVRSDHYGYVCVLSLCGKHKMVALGKQVHSMVLRTGFSVIKESVVCVLITMYFSCGLVDDACSVYGDAGGCGCVMYNAAISGLMGCGLNFDALIQFKQMLSEESIRPNELTFLSVMSSCDLNVFGKQIHGVAVKIGLGNSSLVGNASVAMYFRLGDSENGQLVFNEIDKKDVVSWNSLISGYSQHGLFESAVQAYDQMQRDGIRPDEFTLGSLIAVTSCVMQTEMMLAVAMKTCLVQITQVCNSLISSFTKFGEINVAYKIFSKSLPSKNLISWNSMLSGFLLNGLPEKCLELFSSLVKTDEVKPNPYTLSIILSTCASISDLGHGKQIHAYIIRFGYNEDLSLHNALITMYAKCGFLLDWSARIFHRMPRRDLVSWNAMIAAYAQHGEGKEAVLCFKKMTMYDSGIEPDPVTFTIVLSACSHSGFINEAQEIFSSMINDYGIEPREDHLSCIIDLFSRSGHLDKIETIIKAIPYRSSPHIWWALLNACNVYGNVKLGRAAAKFLLEMEPNNPEVHVLLSNMNAAAGQWEEACDVREHMKKRKLKKIPGYSWIESQTTFGS